MLYVFLTFRSTDNLDDELVILPESKSDFEEISGRRIVDIGYFFKQLKEMEHESLFKCNYSHLNLLRERRKGLASRFLFECELCKKKFELSSDNPSNVMPERERVEINLAATSGMVACGIGYSQFEEIMSAMDIPVFNEKFYAKTQNKIFDEWEEIADETMALAAERERTAAIDDGKLINGIPVIDVYADGAWSKRSYGTNYSAMSGVAAIVGRKFGEVLFVGVKNKYCLICSRAKKREVEPKTHVCYKNYEGPSSGMESAIICEGFKESMDMYGIIYGRIIADGDSSTYSKILAADPYPGLTVVGKIECRNHLLRNMCNKLRALGNYLSFYY